MAAGDRDTSLAEQIKRNQELESNLLAAEDKVKEQAAKLSKGEDNGVSREATRDLHDSVSHPWHTSFLEPCAQAPCYRASSLGRAAFVDGLSQPNDVKGILGSVSPGHSSHNQSGYVSTGGGPDSQSPETGSP